MDNKIGTDMGSSKYRSSSMPLTQDKIRQAKMPLSASANEEVMMAWAFEHSTNPTLITDLSHNIQIVNKAFLDWFEFSLEEVIGQNAGLLLRSRSLGPELTTQIPESLNTRGEWQGEVINRSKSGLEKPCLLSITSIYSKEGKRIGYLGVDIDLTNRKEMEAQVLQGEKLSNIGESVATLMHEIRNPLAGISMNVFMLQERSEKCLLSDESERESIQLIAKEVKRLESLVKNALSYARITHLYPQKVSIGPFYEELKKLVSYQLQKNSVEILIEEVSGDLSALFDPDLMKQVFLNLIQNAIEAISDGCESEYCKHIIRLKVDIEEDPKWRCISASARVLLFSIDNCGNPLAGHIKENLFKPFFTSKKEGIGIGLATASKIVRQHHGTLAHFEIDDLPYRTRFTIALPI